MVNIHKQFGIIAAAAILALAAACGDIPGPNEGEYSTVSNVSVSPASTGVKKSGTQTFSASVTGENSPAQTVTWSIDETGTAPETAIDENGTLSVDTDETLSVLTIRATSWPLRIIDANNIIGDEGTDEPKQYTRKK